MKNQRPKEDSMKPKEPVQATKSEEFARAVVAGKQPLAEIWVQLYPETQSMDRAALEAVAEAFRKTKEVRQEIERQERRLKEIPAEMLDELLEAVKVMTETQKSLEKAVMGVLRELAEFKGPGLGTMQQQMTRILSSMEAAFKKLPALIEQDVERTMDRAVQKIEAGNMERQVRTERQVYQVQQSVDELRQKLLPETAYAAKTASVAAQHT
jgi:hypothetical protein